MQFERKRRKKENLEKEFRKERNKKKGTKMLRELSRRGNSI